ncbi:hypothetical protein ACK9YZ_00695 [Rhizobium sp. ZK1]|uniref:hypothetical protein n=1 Tax=Rhizobium sp. ZK1 TaxID=3389872 RepID=UPI0039F74345
MDDFFLNLSPNVRMRLTVAEEMALDDEEKIFTEELYQKYLGMHRQALSRQDATLKTLVLADAGLAMLLFGKNIAIPGTTIGIQDIPAAIQVLTALASLAFFTLSQSFLNAQLYLAIVEQFAIRRAKVKGIDPDFLVAADSLSELYLKVFRRKMNVWGVDFFEPSKSYIGFYTAMTMLMLLTWSGILILHLAIIFFGLKVSFAPSLLPVAFCAFIALMHAVGILLNVSPSFDFKVRHGVSTQRQPPNADHQ